MSKIIDNKTQKKMQNRVKALLAKTVANGCTEEETSAAQEKARELMAAYEITGDPENLFDKIYNIFERHVVVEKHYLVVFTLWSLHMHTYQHFASTPRLILLSPVENCGKTTVLAIIKRLGPQDPGPQMTNDITPASLFRVMDAGATVLVDEADNARIQANALMRAILNGNNIDSTVKRTMSGLAVTYYLFTPVALATIGALNATLMSRAIVVKMKRAGTDAKFTRLDLTSHELLAEIAEVNAEMCEWGKQVNLNVNPVIPAPLGRTADNWRPLLAIADSLDRGEVAREAAITCLSEHVYENENITLLRDIRLVFTRTPARELPSDELLKFLKELEDGDGEWSSLTQKTLAIKLRIFEIKTHSVWWPENVPRVRQRSRKGYARSDFETTWRRYLK